MTASDPFQPVANSLFHVQMTTLRDRIADLIKTISDPSEQFGYEANVPIANVPAELICMWFDDLYHPETELFRNSFSADERKALADFHDYYDARADKIPDDGGVDALQKSAEWLEVQERANVLLRELGWFS